MDAFYVLLVLYSFFHSLLWRLFSIVPLYVRLTRKQENDVIDYFDLIDDVMTPFVRAHIDGKANITRYTQFKEELTYHSRRLKFVFVTS